MRTLLTIFLMIVSLSGMAQTAETKKNFYYETSVTQELLFRDSFRDSDGGDFPVGWQAGTGSFEVAILAAESGLPYFNAGDKYLSCTSDGTIILTAPVAAADSISIKFLDGTWSAFESSITTLATETWAAFADGVFTFTLTTGQAIADIVVREYVNPAWYGVEWDATQTSPDLTRIASDMAAHASLPVHSLMRGCILKDNGTVAYYLDPDDWTKRVGGGYSDLSGGDGQVMVEIPAHYEGFETDGDTYRVKISLANFAGASYHPKIYIGAYKAALDRTNSKLASVVNTTAQYRGGNNNATLDAADNTQLGKPATVISRTNFRTYAQARGSNWSIYSYQAWKKLYWLYVIEYATLNSQKAYNETLDASGYRQGGLGNGVTTVSSTDWNTYNGYYPLIPCGTSNGGNATDAVDYSIPGFPGATGTVSVIRYRGVENPFGDIWEWVDGVNIQNLETEQTATVYLFDNPNYFTDDNGGLRARSIIEISKTSGYINQMQLGLFGDIIPTQAGGTGSGATAFYSDYHYSGYANSYWGWRALLVGGYANNGSSAGFVYSHSSSAASYTHAYFGSRLCFLGE